MPEKTGRSKVEFIKEASRQLRGTIAAELAADSDHFGDADKDLLKFHGSYQQDDRDARKKRPPGATKKDKQYIFMVRSRIPGGKLTAAQYLAENELADAYGNGTLRITTRQGFQLHGILKRNLKATIHRINEVLLSTLAACGDVERNVMCCPAPDRHDSIRDQLQATADAIAMHLAPRTRAYHEIWLDGEKLDLGGEAATSSGEENEWAVEPIYGKVYLPRKFKTGIALPDDNCTDVYANDIGLLAITENGRLIGYNVLVGGGMGMTPSDQDTFPAVAKRMAFIEPEQVLPVVTAIVMVQRDFGNRASRKQARMKYLIHNWGLQRFKEKVEEYAGLRLPDPHPAEVHRFEDHLGWHPQGDGKLYLGLCVENGRIKDEGKLRLKTALQTLFQKFGMNARLTAHQNILLIDLDPAWREEIEAVLRSHAVRQVEHLSLVRRLALACPAMPTCGLAVTESERVLPSIIDDLQVKLAQLGLDAERFTIHMTGCPNGCARPYSSDIGLVGHSIDGKTMQGKYEIYVGGSLLGTRLNFSYKDLVLRTGIVSELLPLFVYFKADRGEAEGFGDFCHRKGRDDLLRFDAEYKRQSRLESNGERTGIETAETAGPPVPPMGAGGELVPAAATDASAGGQSQGGPASRLALARSARPAVAAKTVAGDGRDLAPTETRTPKAVGTVPDPSAVGLRGGKPSHVRPMEPTSQPAEPVQAAKLRETHYTGPAGHERADYQFVYAENGTVLQTVVFYYGEHHRAAAAPVQASLTAKATYLGRIDPAAPEGGKKLSVTTFAGDRGGELADSARTYSTDGQVVETEISYYEGDRRAGVAPPGTPLRRRVVYRGQPGDSAGRR